MKILAIESSGLVASVAIAEDDRLIAEYTTDYKKTHSETLMPMVDEICCMTETDPKDFDAVAISKGPGSFTGLRIGAATAKGLCLSLGIKLIPVSTLASMAYNFCGTEKLIVPIMDARRDQVYTGIYSFTQEYEMNFCKDCGAVPKEDLNVETGLNKFGFRQETILDDMPMSVMELLTRLNAIGEDVIFLGDGVPAFKDVIERNTDIPFTFAPFNLNRQKASSLAALAFEIERRGGAIDAKDFAPDYFRASQAERVRAEKNADK